MSSFISTFHAAGGHVILGQATKWNAGNEESQSNEALLMDQKADKGSSSPVLAPIWIP